MTTELIALDSSCWLEVLGSEPNAPHYERFVAQPQTLLVPILTVYEVYKYLRRNRSDAIAQKTSLYMLQGKVIDISAGLIFAAAANGLPLADSLIYATARAHGATLYTQDAHFDGLEAVVFRAKQ